MQITTPQCKSPNQKSPVSWIIQALLHRRGCKTIYAKMPKMARAHQDVQSPHHRALEDDFSLAIRQVEDTPAQIFPKRSRTGEIPNCSHKVLHNVGRGRTACINHNKPMQKIKFVLNNIITRFGIPRNFREVVSNWNDALSVSLQNKSHDPIEIAIETARVFSYNPEENTKKRMAKMDLVFEVREEVRIRQQALKDNLAARYNKKVKRRDLEEGDPVLRGAYIEGKNFNQGKNYFPFSINQNG
ncbi:hypothetical protein PIB30_026449 [Stylosanthes scabra]|uniref:Uncharacterized protein n=1 Tax=Stylosanthes scabra TaxID=79078 RepID=A0ABU6VBU1_9FABA|nr:hypothetical protein [Stylosanthes scabra]